MLCATIILANIPLQVLRILRDIVESQRVNAITAPILMLRDEMHKISIIESRKSEFVGMQRMHKRKAFQILFPM